MTLADEVAAYEQRLRPCTACEWLQSQPDYDEWVDILASAKQTMVLLRVAKVHGATFSYSTLQRHRAGHP